MVAADARAPRDGNFIERLGTYNPLLEKTDANHFTFKKEKIEYWLNSGAVPSERAAILLFNNGFKTVEKYLPTKYPRSEKEREQLRQKRLDAEEAKKAAKQKEKEDAEKAEAKEVKESPTPTENQKEPTTEVNESTQQKEKGES